MRRLIRALRMPALAACLCLAALTSAHGQTAAPSPVSPTATVSPEAIDWKWLTTQGGLSLFALVILWSYRRDMARLLSERDVQVAKLAEALTAATVALTAHAESSREQASAYRDLAESVKACEAVRKILAER